MFTRRGVCTTKEDLDEAVIWGCRKTGKKLCIFRRLMISATSMNCFFSDYFRVSWSVVE